jgi:hypothetical protein
LVARRGVEPDVDSPHLVHEFGEAVESDSEQMVHAETERTAERINRLLWTCQPRERHPLQRETAVEDEQVARYRDQRRA